MKNYKGFTLAEVLITLAIIGVVAAITIPSIVANKDKQAWTSQLKKTYASLENARRLAISTNGEDMADLFSSTDSTAGNAALTAMAKHLSIAKNCGAGKGCWYDGMKFLNGTYYDSFDANNGSFETALNGFHGKAILADGTLIDVANWGSNCTLDQSSQYSPAHYKYYCGAITIDVNGIKPPNTLGKDVYVFDVTKEGFYPHGIQYSNDDIFGDCQMSQKGWGCAARVLKEGGINY